MITARSRRSGSSLLLLTAGVAVGLLCVSASTGCAGKRRAMKQKEAEQAAAAAADEPLDLASLSKTDSARKLLDSQDPSMWTEAPNAPKKKGSTTQAAAPKGSGIYQEAPLALDNPGAGVDNEPAPRANRGNKIARTARSEPAPAPAPDFADASLPVPQSAGASPSGRELAHGEAAVNAPVQIPGGIAAAPVQPSAGLSDDPATLARSRETLAAELAKTLNTGKASPTPVYRDGVSLLALDLVGPGSVNSEIAAYTQRLSASELASFESLRTLFRTISNAGDATSGWDGGRINRVVEDHLASTAATESIAIRSAVLCTSVDGFGRYTPYASTTFTQGRATPAILYISLDHVTQKQTDGNWSIDLVQSAKIYHDTDNLVVEDLGEQAVRDSSRDRRRDFCIARRIDLPANLTLGRFNLKISIRDQATGAIAEETIPVQIVGNQTLTSRSKK